MYQHILLDLDDTIFDFQAGEVYAIKRILKEFDLKDSTENIRAYNQLNKELWKHIESGEMTKQELLQQRFPKFLAIYGITVNDNDGLAIDDQFRQYLVEGTNFMPGAEILLENLKKLHKVSIYAATNGIGKTQRDRLEKLGLEDYFKQVYISEEIGFNKPDARFFEYILSDLSPSPKNKIVMIGDSLTSDMEGARRSNLDAIWFNPFKLDSNTASNPAIIHHNSSLLGIWDFLYSKYKD